MVTIKKVGYQKKPMSEKMEVWCAGQEWCPVTATAEVIGKKWYPVIVHRLLDRGPIGFEELKREVDGISSKVLSENLDSMQEKGLVEREEISEKPVRVRYSLTSEGESLEPVISEMMAWGREHLIER